MQDNLLPLLNATIDTSLSSVTAVTLNLAISLALGLVIALVYRRTHHGISYSQGFVISLVLVTIIAAAAMMVIGSNLARAFGLVGALSIIRYRTVIKDTKDAAYIFLALVVGFASGVGAFHIAVLTTAIVLAVTYVLTRYHFGILHYHDFILSFNYVQGDGEQAAYNSVFDEYCTTTTMLHAEPGGQEGTLFLTFDVSLREGQDSTTFIDVLNRLDSVNTPKLVFASNDASI